MLVTHYQKFACKRSNARSWDINSPNTKIVFDVQNDFNKSFSALLTVGAFFKAINAPYGNHGKRVFVFSSRIVCSSESPPSLLRFPVRRSNCFFCAKRHTSRSLLSIGSPTSSNVNMGISSNLSQPSLPMVAQSNMPCFLCDGQEELSWFLFRVILFPPFL